MKFDLPFCVFRKYDGTVCYYGNKPRNITPFDCLICEVPEELRQEKRAAPDRRTKMERRISRRFPDRRMGERRKLTI